jgi:hypothetical protein
LLPGVIAGLIAGVAMAMFAMLVTAFGGQGLLAPPQMIAEPFVGPFHPGALNVGAFVVGLIVHMMFSAVYGIVFGLIWQGIARGGIVALVGGMVYGLVLWAVMGYVVAPLVGSHIAQEIPTGAWIVAHLMFGLVLGLWPILRPADFRAPVAA